MQGSGSPPAERPRGAWLSEAGSLAVHVEARPSFCFLQRVARARADHVVRLEVMRRLHDSLARRHRLLDRADSRRLGGLRRPGLAVEWIRRVPQLHSQLPAGFAASHAEPKVQCQ